jgi:small subunit ribosomal protein S6
MSRKYEIVYIFDSALEEQQVTERLDRFHELLKSPEYPEPLSDVSHWGKRTLAYPIKNKELGYYVVSQFETDARLLDEFERILKLDESVLRHLIVINEGWSPAPVAAAPPDRGDERPAAPPDRDDERPAAPTGEEGGAA